MKPERPARPADQVGTVERDGVTTAYQVWDGPAVERGNGGPTVVLLPTWSIVPSRMWKAQVPYLARHFRVVTFDGRGSGSSSKPVGAAAYAESEYVADAFAVLDAAGVTECVVVGFSRGCPWALQLAAAQPTRVLGVVCVGSAPGLVPEPRGLWGKRQESDEGWAKYNRYYWQDGGYEEFIRFFFGQLFNEPHSSKQIEDGIRWGLQIGPERLVDTEAARQAHSPSLPPVECPVLVVHGSDDAVRPLAEGERLAELTGGSLVVVEGGGHAPHARDPVVFNRLLKDFVDRVTPQQPVRRTWVRALNRPRRALYLSSPIGLGHAKRDLAIARELRLLRPDLQLDWLAQHPVTRVLEDAGETLHPASSWLLSEAAHVDFEADEHDLHAFQTVRRMDELLIANFLTFADVVDDRHYDLVIADEAWEVDYFLHENPELKHFAYAWLTDFIGWLPMPDGGPAEAALTADYNAEMLEHRARYPRLRDHSLFVGDPEDIVTTTFGPDLPSIRDWATTNYTFTGYITSTPSAPQTRERLGYRTDRLLCVVSVGGSGVGSALLHRVLEAVPLARRLVPGLEFAFVTGPRIDPAELPTTPGVTVHGYLPNLQEHLAVADLAITQGGLTTCMELTALRIPFIYIPLRHHFEQNFHVRHRLDRHNAGHHLTYEEASNPDALAEAIAKRLTRSVDYLPIATDGAARAATLLNELL
ncbi:alpha/beta fold hydrolase [Streptomyces sp. SID13031]|uniref:alpha/beta hydrolase n=1 Tax=Streptomyces sp. SID13031 TaxID=2706046 RepID=UPI0013C94823|nr:alpha/beta fold hydrolase [Streptomyces sp. SID13031]NEA32159.1 alpha/beta fold hydrolase [Streptomyces sp. SID13031]